MSMAPFLEPDYFVGRVKETDRIHDILRPNKLSSYQHTKSRTVVLGGIGGIGKTQLAIAYARRHEHSYTSVLWLNATSEITLHTSLRSISRGLVAADELKRLDDEQVLARMHEWLSQPHNPQWLLIFDNYDEPDQFDLNKFYPNIGHGSIIITTRLPDRVAGLRVAVDFTAIDDSLDILRVRSGRKGVKDG